MRGAIRKTYIWLATIVLVALVFTLSGTAMAGDTYEWVFQNPLPEGQVLAGVSATSPNDVWAVGSNGVIIHYNGSTLTRHQSNTTRDLYNVSALDSNHVWAVGEEGTILFYNGSTWSTQMSGTSVDLTGVASVDANNVWAVGSGDFVDATALYFNGSSWTIQGTAPTEDIYDVSGVTNDGVFAVDGWTVYYNGSGWSEHDDGSVQMPYVVSAHSRDGAWSIDWDGTVMNTTDQGYTWNDVWTGYWPANIYALSANDVWVVGWEGNISYYDGSSWKSQNSGVTVDLYDVCATGVNDAWAVGPELLLEWDGGSWSEITGGVTTESLYGVDALTQEIVVAVGGNGTFVYTLNGGISWNSMPCGTTRDLYDVDFLDGSHMWAVGARGTIRFWNGSGWSGQSSGTTRSLQGVYALDTSHVWAVGDNGTILFYNGSSWSPQNSGTNRRLRSVAAINQSVACAVGDRGTFIYTVNGGASWNSMDPGTTEDLMGVSALNAQNIWAVGVDGVIVYYDGSGWTTQAVGGSNLNGVSAVDGSHVWTVGEAGTIRFYDGSAWADQASGTAVGLNAVSAPNANNAWAVGDDGVILYADPPFIKYCSPTWGNSGDDMTVSVVGAYTNFGGGSTVDFGEGVTVTDKTVWSSQYMDVDIHVDPDAAQGPRKVSVTTGEEVASLEGGFVVDPEPVIESTDPVMVPPGWTGEVLVTGNQTHFGIKSQADLGNGVGVNYNTAIQPESIRVSVKVDSSAKWGPRNVNVVTGDETPQALQGGFVVGRAPTVMSVSPDNGMSGNLVEIKGKDFRGFRGSSCVKFGKQEVTLYKKWSDDTIRVEVPEGATSGKVKVITDYGTSNGVEFEVNQGQNSWYVAEGTTAWGFHTYLTVTNPNDEAVSGRITYMTKDGPVVGAPIGFPPRSQTTLDPRWDLEEDTDFSTKVEALNGKTIAVDRTMHWTGTGAPSPDGHCSIGVTGPGKAWYLPEGSSDWGFESWLLIQNPNADEATVTITYMTDDDGQFTFERTIPPTTRRTYSMVEDIGVKDSSIKVTSEIPVIAERSMYRDSRRQGHDSVGATAMSNDYFLAEGSTDHGFTTYVLVQNPGTQEAEVTLTYMTSEGPVVQDPFIMPPNSRSTIRVNDVLPGADFSTHVASNRQVVAERAMYWGADTPLGEAGHDSIGLDAPHTVFYLPDGQTSEGHETYVLVQNPNDCPVDVVVTYLLAEGRGEVTFTDTIPANSRDTYDMAAHVPDDRASTVVTCRTQGRKIMVERAMYWNSRGAGASTIGAFHD